MLRLFNSFASKLGSIKEQKTEGMAAVVAYLMFASYYIPKTTTPKLYSLRHRTIQ
ncbi:hypothetical protein [Nostoc commune]|uniref:hypothetical protein n=1 Tax=Nostoc commune TaxID=1178 RepID=UPI0018C4E9CA|nr:hypothetical protein [Nostoc commune]